jgi:hypothetical protein
VFAIVCSGTSGRRHGERCGGGREETSGPAAPGPGTRLQAPSQVLSRKTHLGAGTSYFTYWRLRAGRSCQREALRSGGSFTQAHLQVCDRVVLSGMIATLISRATLMCGEIQGLLHYSGVYIDRKPPGLPLTEIEILCSEHCSGLGAWDCGRRAKGHELAINLQAQVSLEPSFEVPVLHPSHNSKLYIVLMRIFYSFLNLKNPGSNHHPSSTGL